MSDMQVLPSGVIRAMDGDVSLDVEVEDSVVTLVMTEGERTTRCAMSPTTMGFFIGAIMRVLDPDNLAGLKKPEEPPELPEKFLKDLHIVGDHIEREPIALEAWTRVAELVTAQALMTRQHVDRLAWLEKTAESLAEAIDLQDEKWTAAADKALKLLGGGGGQLSDAMIEAVMELAALAGLPEEDDSDD